MNANPKFLAATAQVDDAAVQSLPSSRKVYVMGAQPGVRVPMREISQSDTSAEMGAEKNPPLYVYDTSGPYSDPAAKVDIRKGLAPMREAWIEARGDTVLLEGPSSEYGRVRLADIACPTLVVAARGDRLRGIEDSRILAAGIPSARLEIMENCGHMTPLERPEALNALIVDWLS